MGSKVITVTHQDHRLDPPGHSCHWHQVHRESVPNLDLSGVELFSFKEEETILLDCL